MIGRLLGGCKRLANAFLARFGAVLLLFGLGLFLIGASVQGVRMWQLTTAEQANAEPDFTASIAASSIVPASNDAATDDLASDDPARSTALPTDAATRGHARSMSAMAAAMLEPTATPIVQAPMPERIEIPAIGVDTPVVEVGWEARIVNGDAVDNVWQTADFAAGFHRDSARLGEVGNTVLSGHNNIQGSVFRDLYDLKPGDEIILHSAGRRWVYAIENKFVVHEEGASEARRRANAQWIDPTPDERLTLISCYPPWSNTHRVIVVARPTLDGVAEAAADSSAP
jgi:sortase A